MNDIVLTLKDHYAAKDIDAWMSCLEAADEIERLRAWNEEIALNARKFAEALREIMGMDEVAVVEFKKGDGWLHQRVARAALEGK